MVQLDSASILPPSRDRQHFPGFYEELDKEFEHENRESQGAGRRDRPDAPPEGMKWFCTGLIEYDTTLLQRDIDNLKQSLEGWT